MSNSKKRKFDHNQPETLLEKPASEARDTKGLIQRTSIAKRRRQHKRSPAPYGKEHSTSPKTQHPPSPTKLCTLLASCHICHRRPMIKTDLTGYADCDCCSKRTCYICMRECEELECKMAAYTLQYDQPITDPQPRKQASEGRGKMPRLCRDCTVESIYADGTDMTICLHCAEGQSMWDSPRSTGEFEPP